VGPYQNVEPSTPKCGLTHFDLPANTHSQYLQMNVSLKAHSTSILVTMTSKTQNQENPGDPSPNRASHKISKCNTHLGHSKLDSHNRLSRFRLILLAHIRTYIQPLRNTDRDTTCYVLVTSQASCVTRDGLERRCLRPLWLMLTLYTAISIRLNNTSPQSTVSLPSSLQITHSGISSFSCSNLPLFPLTITTTFSFCLKPISA